MHPTHNKGFTIIEVVLVLAIAGLIFLIVFLALPSLQRQQRDTQRRSDASRALTAVQNYRSNNKGAVPDTQAKVDTLLSSYIKASGSDVYNDPSGTAYTVTWVSGATADATDVPANTVKVYTGAKCNGEASAVGTTNQVAIRIDLENGGNYCISNGS